MRLGALRRLFSAPHSGECLSVCTDPSHNRLLAPPEAQLFFRWRLGLPLSANPPQLCLACQCPQDPFGDHTLCCSACGIYGRHNFVRDALGEELQDSGFKVSREVPIPSGGGRRPADLLIEALESEPLAADIGLVHPLLLNNSLAGVFAGTAAERRAYLKVVESADLCRASGWGFVPVVVETTGAWSKGTHSFVRRWATAVSMTTGTPFAECFSHLSRRLSFLVARAVAKHLLRGFGPSMLRLPVPAS